jgi:hypothetical protein
MLTILPQSKVNANSSFDLRTQAFDYINYRPNGAPPNDTLNPDTPKGVLGGSVATCSGDYESDQGKWNSPGQLGLYIDLLHLHEGPVRQPLRSAHSRASFNVGCSLRWCGRGHDSRPRSGCPHRCRPQVGHQACNLNRLVSSTNRMGLSGPSDFYLYGC